MDVRSEALSLLGWWQEAGVDVLVDERPRDWLKPAPRGGAAPADPVPEPDALPATIAAMHARLASSDLVTGAIGRPLAPEGDPAAGLMLLVDMPDPGDPEAGRLVSGDAGRLLDRMLRAIGQERAALYLAPFAPARPAGGRVAAADLGELGRLARQHVALARPRLLLAMGDAAAAAIVGHPLAEARGRVHDIDHRGAAVGVVATFHPRYLLRDPGAKAKAWADLRLLLGRMTG